MKIRVRDPLTGLPLQALHFMADGDGAGGGGGGTGGTGDGGQGGSGGSGGTGTDAGSDKTFTQADVERMITERLARERGQTADLRAKAAKWDEHEANSASELEKATKKAADERESAVRAEVTAERVLDKIEVAAAGKFEDLEDARLRLGKRAAEFVKDGKIDNTAITAAVEQLLKDAPHLAKKTETTADAGRAGLGGQSGNGGGGGGAATVQPGLGRLQHAYANSPTSK